MLEVILIDKTKIRCLKNFKFAQHIFSNLAILLRIEKT